MIPSLNGMVSSTTLSMEMEKKEEMDISAAPPVQSEQAQAESCVKEYFAIANLKDKEFAERIGNFSLEKLRLLINHFPKTMGDEQFCRLILLMSDTKFESLIWYANENAHPLHLERLQNYWKEPLSINKAVIFFFSDFGLTCLKKLHKEKYAAYFAKWHLRVLDLNDDRFKFYFHGAISFLKDSLLIDFEDHVRYIEVIFPLRQQQHIGRIHKALQEMNALKIKKFFKDLSKDEEGLLDMHLYVKYLSADQFLVAFDTIPEGNERLKEQMCHALSDAPPFRKPNYKKLDRLLEKLGRNIEQFLPYLSPSQKSHIAHKIVHRWDVKGFVT